MQSAREKRRKQVSGLSDERRMKRGIGSFMDLHLKRVADGTETKVEMASGYIVSQPVPAA
jgi:hypothetical protein